MTDIEDILRNKETTISHLLVKDINTNEEVLNSFIKDIIKYFETNEEINNINPFLSSAQKAEQNKANTNFSKSVKNTHFDQVDIKEDNNLIEKPLFKKIIQIDINKDKYLWNNLIKSLRKKHKINPSTVSLNYYYYKLLQFNKIKRCEQFEKFNRGKQSRTSSGITQITVVSSPYPNGQKFSCEYDCYYCPNEPAHKGNNWQAQPRSYLYNEPAVKRANTYNFDAAEQMWARMSSLLLCGLPIDKLEVMVLGGTWSSYPEDYRENFIRDLYYAANTFYEDLNNKRSRKLLEEEIHINETALVRVIGLTLETRPDCITYREIQLFRQYNCTRIQIGVQHTNDRILSKINRRSYLADTKRAIKNLLDIGLKVDVHLMFDLPYASQYDDYKMIDLINECSELRFDQVKFYPFSSLDWTKTKEWEDAGKQLHYTADELIEVILYAKQSIPEWVRINRVIRDIPSDYITAGNNIPNLRQVIHREMEKEGWTCKCIRCREPKNNELALKELDTAEIVIRKYEASNGIEYFISYESKDRKWIYGFCRLRLSKDAGYITNLPPTTIRKPNNKPCKMNMFSQLNNSAIIRELHVYGNMNPVDTNSKMIQHRGIGRKLIKKAEWISMRNGYNKISIISGVGVREYYKNKLGYKLNGTYMEKKLYNIFHIIIFTIILGIILFKF
jgi:ELP3 family radical SAM enzyme/protein acetyltransferase